jgi:hypothetical protein
MMTFSQIESKLKDDAVEVKDHVSHIFHSGVLDALSDVKNVEAQAKSDALVAIKDATPEIQAAVQLALETVEKAVLAYIEGRLA